MIVDERMVTFIHSLETENSEVLETIEKELSSYDPGNVTWEINVIIITGVGLPRSRSDFISSYPSITGIIISDIIRS